MGATKILAGVFALVCLYASTQATSIYYRPQGVWGPWGPYCKCSKSCGGGSQYRERVCQYPPCIGDARQTKTCNTEGCKVDGGWSDWSDYSKCTKSCKSGTQSRTRTCTNPAPANGGKNCEGDSSQSRVCNNDVPCPVDGGWSDWSDYSKCTKSCKSGTQSRTRTCTNPAPANGGKECEGDSSQSRVCNNDVPCPVDGGWSDWSDYSKCTKSCKSGTQSRTRTCTNPAPANGGKDCVGDSSQSRVCNNDVPCPVDGGWSDWSDYSKCTKSCKSGTQSRTRTCTNPAPANGGKKCEGDSSQSRVCNNDVPCPVDGGWSKWSDYSKCSKSCKSGTQSRTRTCTNPAPANGGKKCVGDSSQSRVCNKNVPCPVDGGWSKWSDYSKCSKSCKSGTQSRTRTCTNPAPANGGKKCVGDSSQSRVCNKNVPCPVDGGWSKWSDYSKCSKSCKSGTQSRTRTCTNPAPANGGKKCVGDSSQSRVCNKNVPCPVSVRFHPLNYKVVESDVNDVTVKIVRSGDLQQATTVFLSTVDGTAKKLSDYRPRNKLPVKFKPGQKERKVRIDIINDKKVEKASENFFAKLTSDSPSVKIVPSGSKATIRIDDDDSVFRFKKIRYVVKENVGKVNLVILRSGATNKKQTARIQTKDGTAVSTANGDFQSVGNPTPLSVVFGPGEKHKTVSVKINDDKICEKRERFTVILSTKDNSATVNDKFDVAVVDILDNDVNGGWGKWSPWGKCDKPCGKGRKYRSRKCNNPAPQGGGRKCRGSPRQSAYCYVKRYCPINGGYGEWSKWSSCSRSCGAGSRTRTRVCNKPKPQYGGKPCDGVPKQTRKCYLRACPYAGNTPTPPPYKPPETKPPAYQPPPPYNPY